MRNKYTYLLAIYIMAILISLKVDLWNLRVLTPQSYTSTGDFGTLMGSLCLVGCVLFTIYFAIQSLMGPVLAKAPTLTRLIRGSPDRERQWRPP